MGRPVWRTAPQRPPRAGPRSRIRPRSWSLSWQTRSIADPSVSRPPLITSRNVARTYGSLVALSDVTFDIHPGITGLLGSNGAGKTTLLGMIIGLQPTTSGVLEVLGHDPWSAGSHVRERLGYAPEHHTLPSDMRASDFVRHVAELHGLPSVEAATRASDALWLVGLGEERFRPLGTMSTGQRQRVKLAQAIAHDPDLVLLDEPTDGLDPMQRDAMLDLIARIAGEFGIDIVLSSHLLDEVERICDAVVIIGDGVTLASGTLAELRGETATGVVFEIDGVAPRGDELVRALAGRGFAAESEGRRITVAGDDDSVFDAARDVCAEAGVGILRLHRRRLSLEDVFLERAGR